MLYHSPICFLCIQTGNFKAHPPSLIHVNTSFCKQNKMVETPQQTKQCMMLSTVWSHQVCNFCSHEKIFFSSKVCVASSFVKVENFLLHTTSAKNQILPKPAFTIAKNCLKFWDGKSFMRTLAVFFMEISSDHQFWKRCTNICQIYCL